MDREDLVRVFVSQGPLAAEVAKAKLEANNIAAVLRYSALGRALGLTFDGLGQVEVWARPGDATAARALLAEEEDAQGAGAPPEEVPPDATEPDAL